ncbi:hypothetical protein [Streptomyces catenulae]|uniref:Uncharacterized protein n=1 Tax=Streptomyces catenulae TaxID=66875 RepID=A0ABV2Z7E0_9ACTN|nr:hypothetical protein [Streptomyces catenulae]
MSTASRRPAGPVPRHDAARPAPRTGTVRRQLPWWALALPVATFAILLALPVTSAAPTPTAVTRLLEIAARTLSA